MSEQSTLVDRTAIIEVVDAIFDTVDAKEWDAVERLFQAKVQVDFTSLAGGEPAQVTRAQLVDGWRNGLHPQKQSFHLVGHYRVEISGDIATAHVKGYAYNLLAPELGGAMWEVWGNYVIPFERTAEGWKAGGMTFNALHTRGDGSVRTHVLS
ncbi:nuclear transport factor 2 family protein [Streptosporangium sp. NPDC051023]|uniref:nuclear transport factor 2 family protein n=1 Tax=Streptosporangium sp. NPDC051023 TaxID=3155410 RepID=UPI0034501C93